MLLVERARMAHRQATVIIFNYKFIYQEFSAQRYTTHRIYVSYTHTLLYIYFTFTHTHTLLLMFLENMNKKAQDANSSNIARIGFLLNLNHLLVIYK